MKQIFNTSAGDRLKRLAKPGAAAVVLVWMAATGSASTISAVSGPLAGSGTVGASVSTPSPGNDNVPGVSPNTIGINEVINGFDPFSGFDLLIGLDGTVFPRTEYTVTKQILNNTGFVWTTFSIAVGCDPPGSGLPRGTVPCFGAGANNPLRMDYDLLPTITGAGTGGASLSMPNESYFVFSGLSIAPTGSITLTFNMDAGLGWSGGAVMFQNVTGAGVPEPATYGTMGGALVLMGIARRWHKKRHG